MAKSNFFSKFGIIILLQILFSSSFSQTYYFDTYGVREGIGQSKVYDMVQDKSGFIWLGTAAGISKFNGVQFQNFTTENGLAPNGVKCLHVDTLGRFWFGHISGGITLFDGKKFKVIDIGKITNDITDFFEDQDHNLWISTFGNGVIKINNLYKNEKFTFENFAGDKNLSDRNVGFGYSSFLGMLVIADVGVKYFDKEKKAFEFINKKYINYPQYFSTSVIMEDSKKALWVGTHNGGLYRFDTPEAQPKIYDYRDGLAYNFISCLHEDSKHNIWIGTWGGGISKISNSKINSYNDLNGLPDIEIRCILEDYEGNILIGTNKRGLTIYKGETFVNYQNFSSNKQQQVFALSKDIKGNIWIGTNEGLISANLSNLGKLENIKSFNRDNTPALLSSDIRFIIPDKKGNLWIGTWNSGGVTTYETSKSRFSFNTLLNTLVFDPNVGRGDVTALSINKENNLFVGTYGGLVYYEIDANKADVLTQINGLAGNDISALYTDKSGTTWVGSRGKGISIIKGKSIKIIDIGIAFTPTCFIENSDGMIWVGTESMGAILINGNKIIKKLDISNGLLSNMISAIELDNKGNVYFGTNKGLNIYNINKDKLIPYTEKDGFIGIEIKANSMYKDENGNIWIGTVAGMTLLNTDNLKFNNLEPLTQITRFRVNLQDYPIDKEINLKYNQNSIIIDFQGICISDAAKVRYQIKLEGAEPDWQPITSQTFVNYPSLPPGEYTLLLKACNNHGIWNDKPIRLKFIIHPPFWQTWWFYSIIIILLIISIVTFIKIRERNLRIEKAILEEKVRQRTIEIQEKNVELAQKNKDITDSINYARRIQSALMPPVKELYNTVDKSFILYMPKDIVSGDFYWHTVQGGKTIVAAADCTGHGVPGAFMSMISISSLNQIVKERKVTDPGEILNQLRQNIITALKQSSGESDTKDGLDISLVAISEDGNSIEYAGAYNSLYVVKKNQPNPNEYLNDRFKISENNMIEVKADRMPIGMSEKLGTNFSTISFKIESGDKFFITTDGYIDQFGGNDGKKLMSKRFKELLVGLPNGKEEAQTAMKINFEEWKGKYEQIDDVLVIGLGF